MELIKPPMDRRIKVLIFIKSLGLGGAEKLLTLSLPHLNRERFEYEVGYLLSWRNAMVPEFEKAQIPVFCLNQRRPYDFRVVFQLANLLKERQVDIMHLHLPYAAVVGRLAARLAGRTAVVYTEHSLWEHHRWPTYMVNRLTYPLNDQVIFVSEAVKQSALTRLGHNGKVKMDTVLNGIDCGEIVSSGSDAASVRQELGIPPDHKLVANVANFNPQKRHEDLLKAAQVVVRQEPRVTFLLVGHGRLLEPMKAEARRLGIADNVVFAGFRPDAPRFVAASDMYVLPSQFEGMPVSLLEAMALGKPSVATRVGGVPELLQDGVEGFLVEPLAPEQMAAKILDTLRNPELMRRFSERAAARVREQFGVRSMVQKTEALYEEILVRKGLANDYTS
jgi:glycosyltransferase involved in cell wall biosynthesis